MVKRVGRDTAVRIDKRTATGIGCLVTIGIVLALMIVTFHAIARGDVPENPLTPVGVVLELVYAILTTSTYASVVFGSHSRRRFRSYFLWMLAINTIGLLSDVIYWGIGLDFLPALPRLRETCYFVCYASAFPLLIFYSTYLISYIAAIYRFDDRPQRGWISARDDLCHHVALSECPVASVGSPVALLLLFGHADGGQHRHHSELQEDADQPQGDLFPFL